LASTKPTDSESKQESKCPSCGKPMAADQRYCVECGHRRADARVEFREHLFSDGAEAGGRAAGGRGWNPLAAAALLGLLGIALLVGVLIGKDENDEQPAATTPAAQTTPTTGAATPPTATTPPTTTTTPPGIAPGGSATSPPPAGAGSGGQSGGAAQSGEANESTPTQPEGEGRVTPP
jgi:hypothetical protein